MATTAALDAYGWHLVSELPDDQAEEVWSPCVTAAALLPAVGVWRFHVVATARVKELVLGWRGDYLGGVE